MKSDSLPFVMHLNDKSANSDLDKANLFNIFFESEYTNGCESPDLNSLPHLGVQNTLDFIILLTQKYIPLSNLDTNKACGIDDVGPKMLCCSALALYQVIHHLF